MVRSLLVLVGALAASAAAYPNPGKVAGSTQVHDPTMCKDAAGTYFVFSTGVGIEIRTSTDRTAWTYEGVVFSDPTWTDAYTGTSNGYALYSELFFWGDRIWEGC